MEINEFISSGIIEMYCLGIATEEEREQVEKLASESNDVRDEILVIQEALELYATAYNTSPSPALKNKVVAAVMSSDNQEQLLDFPSRLTSHSTAEEWMNYISRNHVVPPEYKDLYLLDLPGDEKQSTYIVWAKKGAVVQESHADEDEYLLMLKGNCSIAIDGEVGYYREGDFVFIPKGSEHRAEVLSDEPMLIIGQRIAA